MNAPVDREGVKQPVFVEGAHAHGVSQEEAYALARACARLLKERFGVRAVYLFGSVTGQTPWHDRSDIDLAVEGLPPGRWGEAMSALGKIVPPALHVDLFELEEFPELAGWAKGEKTMPTDPLEALRGLIETELQKMERVVQSLQEHLPHLPEEPNEWDKRAVGSLLHDFYTGAERIFERIAVQVDGALPTGDKWHADLLQQMAQPRSGVREAVVDEPLAARLLEHLQFRHRFRHTYGSGLEWGKMRPLAEGLGGLFGQLRARLEALPRTLRLRAE